MQAERDERRGESLIAGWRGTVLVAATYVYFLIFAQFGFLGRLREAGIAEQALKPVMAAMAIGGIVASLGAGLRVARSAAVQLRIALLGCAGAAALAWLPLGFAGFMGTALLIGLSLGVLTVTLVANLRLWTGEHAPLLSVGLGTGLGYWICNIPAVFTAAPRTLAMVAAGACLLGLAASRPATESAAVAGDEPASAAPVSFPLILIWFTALVWLDSAAFFIIQNSPALKAGTWQGSAHLWRTGGVHFAAALLCVSMLRRRGPATALLLAFLCLAGSCLMLLNPARSLAASVLYPTGVSLYSVALVAYPSLLLPGASARQRAYSAGLIYALAGWIGSALGIGMAQHLHRIPVWFVAVAAALFFVPAVWRYRRERWREVVAFALVAATAWCFQRVLVHHPSDTGGHPEDAVLTPAERGRAVYIAEGCINCHSQYVRPHSGDVAMWGPASDVEAVRRQKPALIGNRRQGPDLANVGSRRSALWLRIHTIDPRAVSYGSIMPGYAYLFRDRRGDDLVAYLSSLRSPDSEQHLRQEIAAWRPGSSATAQAKSVDGARLFREECATCHDADGVVRTQWGQQFHPLPPNLAVAPLKDVPAPITSAEARLRLERIVKFGLPGTSMPGHEYLPDAQITALAEYVAGLRHQAAK